MTSAASRRSRTRAPASSVPALLEWFRTHRRPLPWRATRDPYRIWVSEILLQQTRVEQAAPYYERFVRAFPTVRALSRASEPDVLKVWEGAGYYGRARRLREAAKIVVEQHAGKVPDSLEELLRLPGVGPYTARAIASLAFGQAHLALEANGLRVAARWTLERGPLTSRAVRARLENCLATLMPPRSSAAFNEAVMELGETICRPVSPSCHACPVTRVCRAFQELDDPGDVPVRAVPPKRPHVRASVVVVENGGRWWLQRRPSQGLLGGLWEFPGGKIEPGESPEDAARRELREEVGWSPPAFESLGVVAHGYSHFTVELHVFRTRTSASLRPSASRGWFGQRAIAALPLPRATQKILERWGHLDRPGGTRPATAARRRPQGRSLSSPRTRSAR